MSNTLAVTDNGTYKTGKKAYFTVGSEHRKVKKAYLTQNGVHRLCYERRPESTSMAYGEKLTNAAEARWQTVGGTVHNKLAIFCCGLSGISTPLATGYTYDRDMTRGTFSVKKAKYGAACANTKDHCIFAGGIDTSSDILSTTTYCFDDDLTITTLTPASYDSCIVSKDLAGTPLGDGALFCGGTGDGVKATAGMVNEDLTVSSFTALSAARTEGIGAANIDKKYALIAGGYTSSGPLRVVDCYDEDGTRQTLTNLSDAKNWMAGAQQSGKAMFAGGYGTAFSTKVDVYDSDLTKTTATALSQGRSRLVGGSFDFGCAFVGGSYRTGGPPTVTATTRWEFYDLDCTRMYKTTIQAVHSDAGSASLGDTLIIFGGRKDLGMVNTTDSAVVETLKYSEEF